ncbi:MAG TPA: RNase P subunit p30 family protein [Candidatus Nanoarchaeia archaeon]|nr:RNase P subunit p30 family protein [Candidatus Nanoarchaeia archaeon]
MTTDIVLPHNNEADFIAMGKRLGYETLIFVYPFGSNMGRYQEKVSRLEGAKLGILALPPHIRQAQKISKYVFVAGGIREAFEKNSNLIVFNLENTPKDYLHHRSSGLNQVLCKLAQSNEITVAFSFNLILRAAPIERARILGRMRQNIFLCRKYEVKTMIASFAQDVYEMRTKQDLESFL